MYKNMGSSPAKVLAVSLFLLLSLLISLDFQASGIYYATIVLCYICVSVRANPCAVLLQVIRTNGRVGGSWAKDNRRQDRRLRSRTKDAARIGLLGVSVAGHCRPLIILALQLCLRLLSRLSRI